MINETKTLHSILSATSTIKTRKFRSIWILLHSRFVLAVLLSPPSSSSSSTTSVHIDCNIKTESNHHQTAAITKAFDNLAKAAAQVELLVISIDLARIDLSHWFSRAGISIEKIYRWINNRFSLRNSIGNKWNVCDVHWSPESLTDRFCLGPLVTELTSRFTITPPSSSQNQPSNSYICESASRILFQSIDWIKGNACFQSLESVRPRIGYADLSLDLFFQNIDTERSLTTSLVTLISSQSPSMRISGQSDEYSQYFVNE